MSHQGAFCWITYSITKSFEKSVISKCIEDLFIRISKKRYRKLKRKFLWRETSSGEKLLLLGDKREKILDELRVHKYHEKMSRQAQHCMKVETRGPTSDAAQQHALWIYLGKFQKYSKYEIQKDTKVQTEIITHSKVIDIKVSHDRRGGEGGSVSELSL